MGDNMMMLLRNHGTLAVGGTAGDCWTHMFYLERACEAQVLALSGGRDGVLLAPQGAQDEVKAQTASTSRVANPARIANPFSLKVEVWINARLTEL